jgi:hypothetical protein
MPPKHRAGNVLGNSRRLQPGVEIRLHPAWRVQSLAARELYPRAFATTKPVSQRVSTPISRHMGAVRPT